MRQVETQLWQVGASGSSLVGLGREDRLRSEVLLCAGLCAGPSLRTLPHIILTLVSFLQNLHLCFQRQRAAPSLLESQLYHKPFTGGGQQQGACSREPAAGWDQEPRAPHRDPALCVCVGGDVWGIPSEGQQGREARVWEWGQTQGWGAGHAGWVGVALGLERRDPVSVTKTLPLPSPHSLILCFLFPLPSSYMSSPHNQTLFGGIHNPFV